MTERKNRLVLLLISAVICAALIYHPGREPDRKGPPAAFLHYTSGENLIRLRGLVPKPGIYRVPKNATLGTVMKLTAPSLTAEITDSGLKDRVLLPGEIVDVVAGDKGRIDIKIERMKAKEEILLGIPLDPDDLDVSDWESLPGIGPVLAKSIMVNRQKYGDFGSFESLERVPGMGERKMNALRRYFRRP